MDELLDAWMTNNRITMYLLDAVPEEHFRCTLPSGGRSVGEQFGHIHKVRLLWLKSGGDAYRAGQRDIPKGETATREMLTEILPQSADAIADLVRSRHQSGKQVSGFKAPNAAFISYLIAHEAHHRGQIMLILRQSGHPVDKGVSYAMWEWASR